MNERMLLLLFSAGVLTACQTLDKTNYYSAYSNDRSYYQEPQYYPKNDSSLNYPEVREERVRATVDDYDLNPGILPTSHKNIDRNWVSGQNPDAYTIEIGESEKAAQIAAKLHKMPKTDRGGEIKSHREGKTYYKGIYGSYSNYEDAKKALENIPDELKQGATIKNWRSVQENAGY